MLTRSVNDSNQPRKFFFSTKKMIYCINRPMWCKHLSYFRVYYSKLSINSEIAVILHILVSLKVNTPQAT